MHNYSSRYANPSSAGVYELEFGLTLFDIVQEGNKSMSKIQLQGDTSMDSKIS